MKKAFLYFISACCFVSNAIFTQIAMSEDLKPTQGIMIGMTLIIGYILPYIYTRATERIAYEYSMVALAFTVISALLNTLSSYGVMAGFSCLMFAVFGTRLFGYYESLLCDRYVVTRKDDGHQLLVLMKDSTKTLEVMGEEFKMDEEIDFKDLHIEELPYYRHPLEEKRLYAFRKTPILERG